MSLSGHMVRHRHMGWGGGGQLPPPPPSLVRNINYSGNFYLRVGQSSCSCFVSLIFLIFSFHLSLAPCIKTHTKTQEMALKRLVFQNFSGEHAPRPPSRFSRLRRELGKFVSAPPKFLSPYANVVWHVLKQAIIYKLYSPI